MSGSSESDVFSVILESFALVLLTSPLLCLIWHTYCGWRCRSGEVQEVIMQHAPAASDSADRKKEVLAVLFNHEIAPSDLCCMDGKNSSFFHAELVPGGEAVKFIRTTSMQQSQTSESADRTRDEECGQEKEFRNDHVASLSMTDGTLSPCQTMPLEYHSFEADSEDLEVSKPVKASMRRGSSASIKSQSTAVSPKILGDRGVIPDNSTSCAICFNDYEEGDIVSWSKHPSCRHAFHQHCLLPWLMSHDTCPNCRWNYFTVKDSCDV